jgi:hypothetical protein
MHNLLLRGPLAGNECQFFSHADPGQVLGLHVSEEVERESMDTSSHGESAYRF